MPQSEKGPLTVDEYMEVVETERSINRLRNGKNGPDVRAVLDQALLTLSQLAARKP